MDDSQLKQFKRECDIADAIVRAIGDGEHDPDTVLKAMARASGCFIVSVEGDTAEVLEEYQHLVRANTGFWMAVTRVASEADGA